MEHVRHKNRSASDPAAQVEEVIAVRETLGSARLESRRRKTAYASRTAFGRYKHRCLVAEELRQGPPSFCHVNPISAVLAASRCFAKTNKQTNKKLIRLGWLCRKNFNHRFFKLPQLLWSFPDNSDSAQSISPRRHPPLLSPHHGSPAPRHQRTNLFLNEASPLASRSLHAHACPSPRPSPDRPVPRRGSASLSRSR